MFREPHKKKLTLSLHRLKRGWLNCELLWCIRLVVKTVYLCSAHLGRALGLDEDNTPIGRTPLNLLRTDR